MNYNLAFFLAWPVTMYLTTFLFTFASIMYTDKQFDDERAGFAHSKGKWHVWGAMQRTIPFVCVFLRPDWRDVFLAGSICILFFEMGVNVWALDQKPFYKGKTSTLDKSFGKYKWQMMFGLIGIALLTKINAWAFFWHLIKSIF